MLELGALGYGHHLGHRMDTIPQEKAERGMSIRRIRDMIFILW